MAEDDSRAPDASTPAESKPSYAFDLSRLFGKRAAFAATGYFHPRDKVIDFMDTSNRHFDATDDALLAKLEKLLAKAVKSGELTGSFEYQGLKYEFGLKAESETRRKSQSETVSTEGTKMQESETKQSVELEILTQMYADPSIGTGEVESETKRKVHGEDERDGLEEYTVPDVVESESKTSRTLTELADFLETMFGQQGVIPNVISETGAEVYTIDELATRKELGGVRAAVHGVTLEVRGDSGIVHRCQTCKRITRRSAEMPLHQGVCKVHGKTDTITDLRTKFVLDDGTGAMTVVLPRELTEKLLGMTLNQAVMRDEDWIRKDLDQKLMFKPIRVEGIASVDEFGLIMVGQSLEFLKPTVANPHICSCGHPIGMHKDREACIVAGCKCPSWRPMWVGDIGRRQNPFHFDQGMPQNEREAFEQGWDIAVRARSSESSESLNALASQYLSEHSGVSETTWLASEAPPGGGYALAVRHHAENPAFEGTIEIWDPWFLSKFASHGPSALYSVVGTRLTPIHTKGVVMRDRDVRDIEAELAQGKDMGYFYAGSYVYDWFYRPKGSRPRRPNPTWLQAMKAARKLRKEGKRVRVLPTAGGEFAPFVDGQRVPVVEVKKMTKEVATVKQVPGVPLEQMQKAAEIAEQELPKPPAEPSAADVKAAMEEALREVLGAPAESQNDE